MSSYEGGVRTNAFVAGGFLPSNLSGTTSAKYVHVTDWYAFQVLTPCTVV